MAIVHGGCGCPGYIRCGSQVRAVERSDNNSFLKTLHHMTDRVSTHRLLYKNKKTLHNNVYNKYLPFFLYTICQTQGLRAESSPSRHIMRPTGALHVYSYEWPNTVCATIAHWVTYNFTKYLKKSTI